MVGAFPHSHCLAVSRILYSLDHVSSCGALEAGERGELGPLLTVAWLRLHSEARRGLGFKRQLVTALPLPPCLHAR